MILNQYKISAIIALVNIILLVILVPLFGSYYAMSPGYRIFYLFIFYGMPAMFIIPSAVIGIVIALFLLKSKNFISKFKKATIILFLTLNTILLILNMFAAINIFILNNDIYKQQSYEDIIGTMDDTATIRNGNFKTEFATINRTNNKHTVTYDNGIKDEFKIVWISNNEHMLIYLGKTNSDVDTLYGKITTINEKFYEIYYSYNGIAEFEKVEIIK
jgi:hypothetical protein